MKTINSIKEIIESAGISAERGVFTGKEKPEAYCTFLRLLSNAAVCADDEEIERKELYKVTLFQKGNFEETLERLLKTLKENEAYINSVDAEYYETETGYWIVPITLEILKE